ncbi:adenylate cyclase, class 2 [Clostridium amylolyticum]|uniref:Adenylate cyclase, class 2 n=1 Tax=Clostridium amylolyticum TaxID=1121298 RepID=A0A1M6JG05_9CLOT|nr:CYTH domain-containing protein [Clostridium amylolyticum]SHJ45636.1 adenylate cyclase, class 2 [Clostridium amylolyticum]
MKELETKILDIDMEKVRRIMIENKIPLVKKEEQINNIYDFEGMPLLKRKGYARVRVVNDMLRNKKEYYMTVKKMISQEKFKLMEENEVKVDNAEVAKKIFEALGLKLVQSIGKYRESYKYKNTLIEIDVNDKSFCPFPYVEIETTSESELDEVLELLGYTLADTTSKTIYEILEERGVNHSNIKGI